MDKNMAETCNIKIVTSSASGENYTNERESKVNTETTSSSKRQKNKKLRLPAEDKGNGKSTQRKKVYRSIFGPQVTSESESETNELSYSSESEDSALTEHGKSSTARKRMDESPSDNTNELLKERIEKMKNDQKAKDGEKVEDCLAVTEEVKRALTDFEQDFLSPEEKEAVSSLALSHIAEELNKRNSADSESSGTKLYTGPYGRIRSPFKKFSSLHCFPSGVKRSPRKLAGPAAKRSKLFHEDSGETSSSVESPPEDIKPRCAPVDRDKDSNEASGGDSSDEEKLEIIEDDQNSEFDKKLEDKSSKFSLSVMNVKSIIHKIVTNENVIEMVRKAVQEEMDEHELRFEPKMTRSKLKQFEAQGQVPPTWGLSPKKKRESPNFLEMELPEDEEDDEDFNPDKVIQESDEDSESVLSSCLSDIGSPAPSTPKSMPSTPTVTPSQTASTPVDKEPDVTSVDESSSQSFLSPMGPPLQTSVPKSQHKSSGLGKKYQEAMEREKQRREEEAELIASRTRSKYPLTDCSIVDIEANFVAPDITQDMYETCDDYDWAEFLSTLIRFPDDDTLTNNPSTINDEEDTEDDPEYNYQAECETYEFDLEDYRSDRAVKVSKREVNELLDDILNDENEDDAIDEQYKFTIKTQSEKIVFNSNKKKQTAYQQSLISAIGQHERRQIDDQLRKHVQQLAQTYVMAQTGIAEHQPVADAAKFYLNELSNFAEKSEILYGKTAFRVCNLEPALCLFDEQVGQETEEMTEQDKDKLETLIFKYDSQILPAFNYKQMLTMWTSPVFMFPDLLPHGGFFKHADIKRDRSRVKFLEPEDNLLAMGIAQFSHLKKDAKEYIQRFMLPCKSRKQIEIRIKNLNAKASKDNAVKFYKRHKKLPRFPQYAPELDISMMKSLKESEHDWNELPLWCRFFCAEEIDFLNESTREKLERLKEMKRRRKERQAASFSLSDTDVLPTMTPPHPSTSAPVTPQQQQTDSSMSSSSGSESVVNLRNVKRKRTRWQSRRRLNMSKGKKAGMGVLGSCVPLPLQGSSIPQQQTPLTICVLDNVQGVTRVPSAMSPCIGRLQGNSMATCATPTIVVINNSSALQVPSLNQTATLSSSQAYQQTVTQYTPSPSLASLTVAPFTQSSLISQSMPAVTVDSTKSDSEVDSKALTFEDICRPIMEAEMATGDVMQTPASDKELCTLYSENGSVVSLNSVKNDLIVNIVEDASLKSSGTSKTYESSGSVARGNAINDHGGQNTKDGEIQSSEISSTVSKNQTEASADLQGSEHEVTFQDTASSPFVTDHGQEGSLQREAISPSGEQERDTTLTDSLSEQSNFSPTQELDSPKSTDCQSVPKQTNSGSNVSSAGKTQTSSIDVVAALAPYFISPIRKNSGSLQSSGEKTPTKRKLPTLAPKSPSPGQRSAPLSFSDLSPMKRKSKVKYSPRKKRLQQQVKTILPKGFVYSPFDTSPAKKAASSLVDRAKHRVNHSKGFCKILPRPSNVIKADTGPENLLSKSSRRGTTRRKVEHENNSSKMFDIDPQNEAVTDDTADDMNENNNAMADDDDKCGDTESDYTQSEDGNETQGTDGDDGDTQGTDDGEGTQGTDGDSQDSQEEDNHIADLMAASTTIGFVPSRDDLYSRSRLGKKDRDRDLTLALLEPDIVEADPQRDLRDTLFAQAYIHKVKKALRDDFDTYEKFLKIMCSFSEDGESPVKLYKDLQELFSGHQELIHDFAGFLYPAQAIECGCYKAYQEFMQARTFLRKLEIYFNKNPNQLQKVMRTFSRWYKKPGRKEADLREQIEPMLKGQKFLLEEFSRFFPNERPSESQMDDFEEINLDDSGENEDKDTSFEEIELLDMEEAYGTKRCVCGCHDDGDDTYRKRKKHCYKCCLTVIDGELVYKVNKSTIKKISVTYGPPVKLSSLKDKEQSKDGKQEPVPVGSGSQEIVPTGSTTYDSSEREPANIDWFLDPETAEKENIEHFSEGTRTEKDVHHRKTNKAKSPNKESFLQRISKLSRSKPQDKSARLSSVIKGKSLSPSSQQEGQLSEAVKEKESVKQMTQLEDTETEQSEIETKGKSVTPTGAVSDKKSESTECMDKSLSLREDREKCKTDLTSEENKIVLTEEAKGTSQTASGKGHSADSGIGGTVGLTDNVSNDILATAFSSALNAEVSMDTSCFALSMPGDKLSSQVNANSDLGKIEQTSNETVISKSVETAIKPTVVSSVSSQSAAVLAPVGQSSLHVSSDSSFQKVPSSEYIVPVVSDAEKETGVQVEFENNNSSEKEDKLDGSESKQVSKIDYIQDASKSPPFSSFSPFSPFAQEIQSITSLQSPLSAIQSPGITRSLSSSGKVRRITPIPVKGAEGKTDSQSSFQTAMENSPVLPDLPISSPCDTTQLTRSKSVDNATILSSNSVDNSSEGVAGKTDVVSADSGSNSQKLEVSSQKSSSNTADTSSSHTSVTSEPSFARTLISQPEIFSENANVGFPKVNPSVSHMDSGHAGLLSEESLFHCLSKPPEFSETIPNVSNLTNILHALDGHSDSSKLLGQSQGYSEVEGSHNVTSQVGHTAAGSEKAERIAANSDANIGIKTKVTNLDQDGIQMALKENEKQGVNVIVAAGNNSGQSSNDSSEEQVDSLHPQSAESIENLKRLKAGLFKVSQLSDSDTSGISTPTASMTNVLDKNSTAMEYAKQTNRTEKDTLSDRVEIPDDKGAKSNERGAHFVFESSVPEDGASVRKVGWKSGRKSFESGSDSLTDTESHCKRKKRKMSRRELRRSLQGKDGSSSMYRCSERIVTNNGEEKNDSDDFHKTDQSERGNVVEDSAIEVYKSETDGVGVSTNHVFESTNKSENSSDRLESEASFENITECAVEEETLSIEVKTEDPEFLDSTGMSDVQSISDTVSEASSRGHKRARHKHKSKHKSDKEKSNKKKRRKDDKPSGNTPKSEKKKKKKARRKEQEEKDSDTTEINLTVQEKFISEQEKRTESNLSDTVPTLTDRPPADTDTADPKTPMSTGGAEDRMEEEPEWTKATDKTILENCKIHGIKEKTFARIAKRIGHVTAKQVKRRFEHLYGIIFGHQFGDSTDK